MEEPSDAPVSHRTSRPRGSRQQLDILIQYMERYPRLALAKARNREALIQSRHMWDKIARTLNKLDENVSKTGRGWTKYWGCRKFRARRKYSIIRKCQMENLNCPITLDLHEEKIIKMITDKDGNLLPVNAITDEMVEFQVNSVPKFVGKPEEHTYDDAEEHITLQEPDEVDIKPFIHEDPIRIEDIQSVADIEKKTKSNIECDRRKTENNKRMVDELRREMLEFELRKQKELFEIEKKQMMTRHKMEMEILQLKKQLLVKELNN